MLQVAPLAGFVPALHRIPQWFGLEAALEFILFHPCHGTGLWSLSSATAPKSSQSVTAQSNKQCHIPQYQKVSFPQKLIPRVPWSAPGPALSCRASPGATGAQGQGL